MDSQNRCIQQIFDIVDLRSCAPESHSLLDACAVASEEFPRAYASWVLAFLAHSTRISLFAQSETLVDSLADIFRAHMVDEMPPIPVTEELVLLIVDHDSLSINFSNRLATVRFILGYLNNLIVAMNQVGGSDSTLEDLVRTANEMVVIRSALPAYSRGFIESHPQVHLYHSGCGPIQVGIPPETIKRHMLSGEDVPQVYVLPPTMFTAEGNFGEVEFPIYFNFFIKKAFKEPSNKIIMIGREDQLDRVRISFQESIFGPMPHHLYLDEDICDGAKAAGYAVDFTKERNAIAYKVDGRFPPIEHFATFMPLNDDGEVSFELHTPIVPLDSEDEEHVEEVEEHVEEVEEHFGTAPPPPPPPSTRETCRIKVSLSRDTIRIWNDDVLSALLDVCESHGNDEMEEKQTHETDEPLDVGAITSSCLFEPPTMGVTFIGTSHGFDPKGRTTGFILWLNGYGVVVDPPIQTLDFLKQNGIPPSAVNVAILTHCHSDHDSGLMRLLLGGTISLHLYTFKTIHESYKRKLEAITNLDEIDQYYAYHQVRVGEETNIHGAQFQWDYSFHTIPTLRFKTSLYGKSISYSADSYYDPKAYSRMVRQGIMNEQREMSLRMFLFDADLIIHEAGIPPIHTSVSILNQLPTSVKKKMWIVHCSGIPDTCVERRLGHSGAEELVEAPITHLKKPGSGVENTIALEVGEYHRGYSNAIRSFDLFCNAWHLRFLSPAKISVLYKGATRRDVRAGHVIIRKGDVADEFFMVLHGMVDVVEKYGAPGERSLATLSSGSGFGESALSSRLVWRSAWVVARTDAHLLVLPRSLFHAVISSPAGRSDVGTFGVIKSSSTLGMPESCDLDVDRLNRYRPFLAENLRGSFLFRTLVDDQIELFASSIAGEPEYNDGDVIFQQGDAENLSFYIIYQGAVKLLKSSSGEEGMELPFLLLETGKCFGEMSLITGLPRSATAKASGHTVLLELTRQGLNEILECSQNLRFQVMHVVGERLKESERMQVHIDRLAREKSPRISKRSIDITISKSLEM